jgi:hypothetical protein
MNDADIIKALECCFKKGLLDDECDECSNLAMGAYCMDRMVKDALDLINRQKAEIERFSRAIHNMSITTEVQMRAENEFQWLQINRVKQARAEAITEFMERAKEKAFHDMNDGEAIVCCCDLDQIAKEMKEGVNNA